MASVKCWVNTIFATESAKAFLSHATTDVPVISGTSVVTILAFEWKKTAITNAAESVRAFSRLATTNV